MNTGCIIFLWHPNVVTLMLCGAADRALFIPRFWMRAFFNSGTSAWLWQMGSAPAEPLPDPWPYTMVLGEW